MTAIAIKGAKAGQDKPRKPSIAKDSVASTSTAKLLYGLAEGEVWGLVDGGKSIRLDGTPLLDDNGNANFEGVTWDFRAGTNEQEYIKGFPDVSNETPINVELRSDNPWIKAFTDTQLSAIRVRFKWNRLSKTNPDNGDVKGYKIQYAIDLQTNGGAYVEVLNTKIEDKTSAGYERTHRIDLPRSTTGWQIRVRRLTANDSSEYVQDDMFIDAVAEVIDVKLRYPNTALLGVQYNGETFSSIAKLEAHVRGAIMRVPSNYDAVARTYTGIWDGTFKDAYSNNPAWAYFYLCTQWRGGLGERLDITMIDKWSLYALGQYCDQMVSDGQGGLEPRFTCNVYLQKQADAYQVLQNIGGIFRAMSYWNGEKVVLDADVPQDPVYTFSRANVIDGNFEYTGTRARDRHTLAKVAWDNPSNGFKTEYEYIRDEKAMAKFGVKVLDLAAFGCTSQAQAQRAGLWALKTEQLETRQVSFGVGLDGFIPQVGNVINVSDELFAGRANGGRISAVSDAQYVVTLDRDVVANAGDVLIANGGGGQSERRTIKSVAGRKITLSAAFTAAEAENIWAIESPDLNLMRFRVMSIAKNDETTFAITAIQHEPQKYDAIDYGTDVKPTNITIINPDVVDAPSSVSVSSRHRVVQGQTVTTLVIEWSQVIGAVAYDVEWRKDDGTWIKLPRTGNVSVEIEGVYSGNYMARVRSVSAFEVQSQATTSTLTAIEGKVGLPPKIVGLTATGVLFGMDLKWGFQQGSGDADYTEIQVGSAPNVNVATLGQYSYPTNTHTINGLQGNLSQSYRARLVDKLGFKSPWSAWVTGTTDANADKVMDLIQGQIDESAFSDIMKGRIADIKINKEAIGQETQDRIAAITAANKLVEAEAEARVEDIRLAAESQRGLQEFADNLAEDVNTVTLAQVETDQGVAAVKERTEAIEIENGVQASKLTYLSSEIDFGYADKTQYADKSRATVWTFAKTVAHADYTNAQMVTGLSADYKDSSARFTEKIELLATKNEATATKTSNLSAQIVGGYDGNDLTKINSGLLFEESKARASDVEALAEQISLLSAGVGEQFDSFDIWHFNKDEDGWTGGTYNGGGWLNVRAETITSPTIEDLDGTAYKHIKLRIKKVGTPTWQGLLSYAGGSKTIAEPSYDADGIALVNWQMEWSGDITSFSLKLASAGDNLNYYSIDWIAVGRPSPGASNASLLRESKVRASETSANASDLVALKSKIDGGNGVPIESSITRKLDTTANLASTTAEEVSTLKSEYEDEMYGYEGTVQTTARTLGEATRAEAERLDLLSANVLPSYADKTQYASSTRSTQWTYAKTVAADNYAANQRITNLQSEFADSNANFTNELFTLATKDKSIAADITQLYAETGANYGLIQDVSIAISTPNTGLAAKVTELQSSAQINAGAASAAQQAANAAATAAGNKGEVIYSSTAPSADKQKAQNLWIDTSGGKNTPKRWSGSAWLSVTDKAATDAASAASAAQGTANSALGQAQAAQQAATASTVKLAEIAADNKLTPTEKKQVKTIWEEIKKTDASIREQAAKYSVSTANYDYVYTALTDYLTPLMGNMGQTNTIVRDTFDGRFANLYERRAELYAAITSAVEQATSLANSNAATAQQAADAAEAKAVLAQSALSEIAADNKLTAVEKKQLIVILADINKTDTEVRSNAAKYSVSLTEYSDAYSALTSYINPKLTDMTATSTIDRAVFNARFDTLYLKRSDVNAAIVTTAEAATAAAQGSANSAAQAASNAQAAADAAAQVAASATIKLSDIAADDKLTPLEKNQVLTIWEEIKSADASVRASATKYSVSTVAYDNVYTALNTYLTPLMNVPEQTSTIVRATFDGRFADLYARRAELNNAIVTATKALADSTAAKLEPANLASLVEGSGAFSDEFGSISGQFANFEAVVDGQKTAMEVISGIGNAEKLKNEIAKARLDKNVTNLNAQSVALQNAIDSYTTKIAELNAKRNAPKPEKMTQAKYNELRAEYAKQIDDITAARTDLTAQKAVIADQVAQLAAEKKVLDDFKEVEDGVRAQHTVKIDNDGKIVGFGLVLQKDGFSTFDVRADRFSISAPSDKPNDVNGNSPFMVLTNPQNINGVTVPAGTYMRNFYAPRGSIDTLQVADAAITTAQIDDLAVSTLKIKKDSVTIPRVQFFDTEVKFGEYPDSDPRHTDEHSFGNISMDAAGGRVTIQAAFQYIEIYKANTINNNTPSLKFEIKRGNTVIHTFTSTLDPTYHTVGFNRRHMVTLPVVVDENPPSGSHIYSIRCYTERNGSGMTVVTIKDRSLHVMGAKR